MKKIVIILLLLPFLLMLFPGDAEGNIYPGYFAAESKEVETSEHFSVTISLIDNDQDVGGIALPIKYTSTDIEFDSASFEGSFVTGNLIAAYSVYPDSNIINLTVIPDLGSLGDSVLPFLATPNGLFATLYFTVSDNPTPGFAVVDSINEVTHSTTTTRYFNGQLSSPDGLTTFYPAFAEGTITILVPTAVEENIRGGLPIDFTLSQNYPNPFNPSTNIEFALPSASDVRLEVYNVLGQLVETLVDEKLPAGYHAVDFDASHLSSGIFFYRLIHAEGTHTKKMVLVK